jgi:23S rRNA pseudouridine1911/1915/1917 synthase
MSAKRFNVKTSDTLGNFVSTVLAGVKKRRVQQLLKHHAIAVNGAVTSRATHVLEPGDEVVIHFDGAAVPDLPAGLKIIFQDKHLLVVDKPPGLLTIADDNERVRTAYAFLTEYVRERDANARVFSVHRLDQGTSGLILFARSEEVKRALQDDWRKVDKRYLAIVEGTPRPSEDTITSRLSENRAKVVYSSEQGDLAITHYRVLQTVRGLSLVEVNIETGRKNQIRVHLSDRGHPVVGDKKYGAHANPVGRLALHATHLSFTHPVRGERMTFDSPLPPKLQKLVNPV